MFRSALKRVLWHGNALKDNYNICHHGCEIKFVSLSTKVAAPSTVQQNGYVQPVGQPTPYTHSHIMANGELTPGIQLKEYVQRRSNLVENIWKRAPQIVNCPENHVIVIPGATRSYMSEKIPYVFRQNSDFLYLTGCQEQDSVLVICASRESSNYRSVIFMRPRDSHSELWDGPRTGVLAAPDLFSVDEALPVGDLETFLTSCVSQKPSLLWFDFQQVINSKVHNVMTNILKNSRSPAAKWESPRPLVHSLRLIKSPAEQDLMRRTCQIASRAIARTMAASKPGISEHQLFARVDYECRSMGAEYLAYPPVVAGGPRANIIHYINNDQVVRDGEMVLMDAGCELHGYTSDITRTWPINGVFSKPQRDLYEALHSVQLDLLQLLNSRPTLDSLFQSMFKLLGRKIVEVGLVRQKDVSNDEELAKAAFSLCPHHVSHYLGMDVHDTALVKQKLQLVPGMVITVEPGIYVNPLNKLANPIYHGMGLRIEDDVLITATDIEILTEECPKHLEDVEATVQGIQER